MGGGGGRAGAGGLWGGAGGRAAGGPRRHWRGRTSTRFWGSVAAPTRRPSRCAFPSHTPPSTYGPPGSGRDAALLVLRPLFSCLGSSDFCLLRPAPPAPPLSPFSSNLGEILGNSRLTPVC